MNTNLCPCGTQKEYALCCGPYHRGHINAPDALSLMRSRYSAFAKGEVEYLLKTLHRENPEYPQKINAWRKEMKVYCQGLTCLGLTILEDEPGEQEASVTFEAHLSQQGQRFTLQEKSRFIKMRDRWFYHSGLIAPRSCN